MIFKHLVAGALVAAAVTSPRTGRAQIAPGVPPRDTATAASGSQNGAPGAGPSPHAVKICIDCHGWGSTSIFPTIILKDAEYRVVMITAPGDTIAARDTAEGVDPSWIDRIDIIKPAAAVAALGRGFEQGIVVVVLTPAGSEAWRLQRTKRRASPIAH